MSILSLAVLGPGQGEAPVDVVAHDGRLGTHGRHHLELFDLFFGFDAGLVGHALGTQALFKLGQLIFELVALAQFFLNRPHLFIEVILLLGAFHLLFDPGADLALDLQNFDLGLHQLVEFFEPLAGIKHLQHALLVGVLDWQMGDDGVGQATGVGQ